ncbi:hypothetical protein D3C81_2091920 [compost metagenome]
MWQLTLHPQRTAESEIDVATLLHRRITETHGVTNALTGAEQLNNTVLLGFVDAITRSLQDFGQRFWRYVADQLSHYFFLVYQCVSAACGASN